jgi:hypothetical protein
MRIRHHRNILVTVDVLVSVDVDGKRVADTLFALGCVGQRFAQLLRLILAGLGLF